MVGFSAAAKDALRCKRRLCESKNHWSARHSKLTLEGIEFFGNIYIAGYLNDHGAGEFRFSIGLDLATAKEQDMQELVASGVPGANPGCKPPSRLAELARSSLTASKTYKQSQNPQSQKKVTGRVGFRGFFDSCDARPVDP